MKKNQVYFIRFMLVFFWNSLNTTFVLKQHPGWMILDWVICYFKILVVLGVFLQPSIGWWWWWRGGGQIEPFAWILLLFCLLMFLKISEKMKMVQKNLCDSPILCVVATPIFRSPHPKNIYYECWTSVLSCLKMMRNLLRSLFNLVNFVWQI